MLSGRHSWDQSLRRVLNRHPVRNIKILQMQVHQSSVTIVLTRLAIDNDFTDIYLKENL